jgi:hypothetical protein
MIDDEKRGAIMLTELVRYFAECRDQGLTPEQAEAMFIRCYKQEKALNAQERRTALRVVKPLD